VNKTMKSPSIPRADRGSRPRVTRARPAVRPAFVYEEALGATQAEHLTAAFHQAQEPVPRIQQSS
jgi:hypothetical protein